MKFTSCLLATLCLATTAFAQVEDFDSIKRYTLKNDNGVVRLLRVESDGPIEIAQCQVSPGNAGELRDSFRYIRLNKPVRLQEKATYILLMSTKVADGDRFHDPVSFDGLSPLVHPHVVVGRSMLVRNQDVHGAMGLPAFEDLSNSSSRYRAPLGPTLLFQQ